MSRIERSIVIERPAEEVFSFLHDSGKDAMWQTTLAESEAVTDGPPRVGAQIREVRRFLGLRVEMTRELTEYAPPTASSFKVVSGPVPMAGSYVLESADGATKLTARGDLDAHGFFKVAEPLFARMAARELETSLGHLKDIIESGRAGF
jgi:polyketide cyclase/dehydrase/lipid transport protein